MDKKKIRITVLGVTFLLLAVIVCAWILKSAQTEQREREEIAHIQQTEIDGGNNK